MESPLAVNPLRGYIFLAGCGGKPAWLNQNRMSSISELASFAARLREVIRASTSSRPPELDPNPKACAARFDALALELFALQFNHNESYHRFCEARGARPATVTHWTQIPAAPTSAFKELALSCLPIAERTTVFHSSGTTAQLPSRHYHNAASLALYEDSLIAGFNANCRSAIGNWRLAILTPPPSQAPHSSLVHMFETIRRQQTSGGGSPFVGSVAADGTWTLQLEAAVALLQQASAPGQPLLILGTAFSFVHLLDHLADQRLRFELPPGSAALETGGYKGRSHSLPKATLHALISQYLGISSVRILCEYGMSELSSQAYDGVVAASRDTPHATRTASHVSRFTSHASLPFCFPPWARVQIISPETGCEVQEGETGLIRVFDLANVYSVMAVQTEDLGIRRGDGFVLAGRVVSAEPRGCSLMAA